MISANDFRPGMVVEMDGELYAVVEFHHIKKGRGTAVVRAKVRNLKTGAMTERTFMPEERYGRAYLDRKPMQYLYRVQGSGGRDGEQYVFMDQQTFDQISVSEALLGDAVRYLKDNSDVTMVFHEGHAIAAELPNAVELLIVDTAPGVRGDTVTGGTKPATVETGTVVQVPLFVERGERIRVDTRTGTYLERVR